MNLVDTVAVAGQAVVPELGSFLSHYDASTEFHAAGHVDEAVTAMGRAVSLLPHHYKAYHQLGILLIEKHEQGDAPMRKALFNNRYH